MSLQELASLALLQIAGILLVCRAVGAITKRMAQPQVVAEMIAGFLLGPSLLGWLAPGPSAWLFPDAAMPVLHVASQLGLVLYMFTVGAEFRIDLLQRMGRTAVAVSIAGIAGPLVLGGALGLLLYSQPGLFAGGATPTHAFMFTGAAMAITAFPVLARIISERGITDTSVGLLALAAGAVGDAAAWVLLAFVLASFSGNTLLALGAVGGAVAYVVLVVTIARPILARLSTIVAREGHIPASVLALTLVLLATGAWFTDRTGVHAVFGAFLLGVAVPRGPMASGLRAIIEPLSSALLVPIFFVYSGLNTELGLLGSGGLWLTTGLIFVVACVGKVVPCWLAARATGTSRVEAMGVATLMNARGMVELILLNIGLQQGIITPTLFTMLALMALGTTLMTGPLFSLVWKAR